jgi:hypothetical protein
MWLAESKRSSLKAIGGMQCHLSAKQRLVGDCAESRLLLLLLLSVPHHMQTLQSTH